MTERNPRPRRRNTRARALQAVYQWDLSGSSAREIKREFDDRDQMGRVDEDFFLALVEKTIAGHAEYDALIDPHLDRPLTLLDPVERSVLRLGVCELTHFPEVPFRVVIDEWVEIDKLYGAEQAHKYINGVLDVAARALRPHEAGSRPQVDRSNRDA